MIDEYWRAILTVGIPAYIFTTWLIYRSRHCGLAIRVFTWAMTLLAFLLFGDASYNLKEVTDSWALLALPLTYSTCSSGVYVATVKYFDSLDRRGIGFTINDGSLLWHLRRENPNKGFFSIARLSIGVSFLISSFIGFLGFVSGAFLIGSDFSGLKHYMILVFFLEIVMGITIYPYMSTRDRFLMVSKAIVFIAITSSIVTAMMSSEFDGVFILQGLSFLAAMLSVAAVIYAVGITVFKEKQ